MPSSAFQTCRSEEHTSELQSHSHLVCRLLLEKKKTRKIMLQPSRELLRLRRLESQTRICALSMSYRLSVLGLHTYLFCLFFFFFFLKDRAPPEIYPFPLPAPLPI